jgi:hypothetical protein
MAENILEKKISNPQNELGVFKEILEKKSFSSFGNSFEKLSEEKQTETIRKTVLEHQEISPQITTPEYDKKQESAEAIVLALTPEEDDEVMEKLLSSVQDNGILNTINAIEKTETFHIKDDFHRFLVQYIKSGYEINLKEGSEFYPGLHMTLFEVSLPETSDEKEKEKTLELLLSSMEQFYAGMFSVSENGKNSNYYSIEIAYPQGRDEVVFFCAIPDEKKNIFKNQVLAIFPNASIKENTNDYNIFNKKKNIAYSEAILSKPVSLPIKTYKDLNYDPLNIILQSFSNLEKSEGAAIQIMLSPGEGKMNDKIIKALDKITKGEDIHTSLKLESGFSVGKVIDGVDAGFSFFLNKEEKKDEIKDTEKRAIVSEEMKKKNSSRFYKTNIRLISAGNSESHAKSILEELESSFYQFENPIGNNFEFKKFSGSKLIKKIKDYTFRIFDRKDFLFLNTSELTSIFHFPEISLNAGDILATSSFTSGGVSRKLMESSSVNMEVKERELRSRSETQTFQQKKEDIDFEQNSEYREEIISENIIEKKKEEETNIDNFILEKPDES